MTSKPPSLKLIPLEDKALLNRIRKAMEGLPHMDLGRDEKGECIELSCHVLARALAEHFPVRVRDGIFAEKYNHSWLVTTNENVIDAYPVGTIGGPILIEDHVARRIYERRHDLYIDEFKKKEFVKAVQVARKSMAMTVARLCL